MSLGLDHEIAILELGDRTALYWNYYSWHGGIMWSVQDSDVMIKETLALMFGVQNARLGVGNE